MSDQQKNSSRSILTVIVVVSVVLVALIWPLSQLGKGKAPGASADDVDTRIQPVARIEVEKVAAAAPAASGKPRDGATIFNTICSACHNTGVAGAPKAGDKTAWGPRIAQGKETLYKSALNGKNAMPPKGGAADLSEAEVKSAVDHIVGLVK